MGFMSPTITVPAAITGEQIEVYSDARYIAITGHHWPGTPEAVQSHQAWLDALVRLPHAGRPPRRPWAGPNAPPPDDLAGALLAQLSSWGVPAGRLKSWQGGYLVELAACPWAHEHSGDDPGGACIIIHPSGARDFRCLHAHCERRAWHDFRAMMEPS